MVYTFSHDFLDVYVCDVLEPQIKEGYEGIQQMKFLSSDELIQ